MADETKVVPPRNDFNARALFAKATIADQAGARPGYHRQWFDARDPNSPLYYGKRLDRHYVGNREVGYAQADGWTLVQRKDAKAGRKRDDDTAGIETAQTHGDLVLMETTIENFEIYKAYDEMKSEARERAMRAGETETSAASNGGKASYSARLGQGSRADDPRAVLNR